MLRPFSTVQTRLRGYLHSPAAGAGYTGNETKLAQATVT
ncbi:hypothetical protein LRHK_923 [Lacticaseibacillus rhamnosus ATCC 8530]|nr:hypothetical protein LRHK_923 [Lacticaseibacillus rhamnosus ATCC 8530]